MTKNNFDNLTNGAQKILEYSDTLGRQEGLKNPGIHLYLIALLERHGGMVEMLFKDVSSKELLNKYQDAIKNKQFGKEIDADNIAEQAWQHAKERGKLQANEHDIAIVVMQLAGIKDADIKTTTKKDAPRSKAGNVEQSYSKSARIRETPTLNQFGRNITDLACKDELPPFIGRESEIDEIITILCSPGKRNPLLLGPAGVGKTAIVEGLARKISQNDVPDVLKNHVIIEIQPSILMAGASSFSEINERMKNIVEEASQPGLLLFIDEVHTVMGSGGLTGINDLAAILKPALARQKIACIAATTNEEYRRYIKNDSALERRFKIVKINEISPEDSLIILRTHSDALVEKQKISFDDRVFQFIIDFSKQYIPNRYFPDKAVDLLNQICGYALSKNQKKIDLKCAQIVAQKMVGMPLDFNERIEGLSKELIKSKLLSDGEISQFANQLKVTMRGYDLRSNRPNAVLLINKKRFKNTEALYRIMAKSLFDDEKRIIEIDLSQMIHDHDISSIIGSPPGYIGFNQPLPIHKLEQTPWCVLKFENIDSCHPTISEFIAQKINDGVIVDAAGSSLYLSNTIMCLTVNTDFQRQKELGFGSDNKVDKKTVDKALNKLLGHKLLSQIDIILSGAQEGPEKAEMSQNEYVLQFIKDQFKKKTEVVWDPELVQWLDRQCENFNNENMWFNWIDQNITCKIFEYLEREPKPNVYVFMQDNEIKIKE
jgi:ATP-dependent Clp protease ATP-binding subunit ClpA